MRYIAISLPSPGGGRQIGFSGIWFEPTRAHGGRLEDRAAATSARRGATAFTSTIASRSTDSGSGPLTPNGLVHRHSWRGLQVARERLRHRADASTLNVRRTGRRRVSIERFGMAETDKIGVT